MRIQPDEAIYLKCNVKAPGLKSAPLTSEMDLSYKDRYAEVYSPDAYTRLLLETLRGNQSTFVRRDELLHSWQIWSPLLEQIEGLRIEPIPYVYGTRGPAEGDAMVKAKGFVRDATYAWRKREALGKL
mmetsp:Transcript_41147/g.128989  ORF Transcript_41147/g.128989 Transcript_41147/m.128989 type:complete len:128 (-) Transcript_41147:52-435(-)